MSDRRGVIQILGMFLSFSFRGTAAGVLARPQHSSDHPTLKCGGSNQGKVLLLFHRELLLPNSCQQVAAQEQAVTSQRGNNPPSPPGLGHIHVK